MKERFRLIVWLLCILTLLLGGCNSEEKSKEKGIEPEDVPALAQPEHKSPPTTALLKIHFIDVGQGDAILIQSPQGENLLIDGGEKSEGEKVAGYLQAQGVKELAAIVGTHPHSDHIGGLIEVIDNFPAAKVYLPAVTHNSQTYEELLSAIKKQQLKISTARAGVIIPLNGLQTEFLAPQAAKYEDLNNYSAVVKLSYGKKIFLFMGDAEKESEAQIMRSASALKADVIKLGHHGSSSSSSLEFLAAAAPQHAVIMCGTANDYGHPHRETLAALNKLQIKVYRTDQYGNIIMTSDGQQINISSERGQNSADSSNLLLLNGEAARAPDNGEPGTVIGNQKSKRFHRPSCRSLPEMQNRVIFSNREAAISEGYVPCKSCKP